MADPFLTRTERFVLAGDHVAGTVSTASDLGVVRLELERTDAGPAAWLDADLTPCDARAFATRLMAQADELERGGVRAVA